MKKPDFEKAYSDFSNEMTKIAEMPSQLDQMRAMLELPKHFENMWNAGYLQGIKEGKKRAFNVKQN